jgi:hypothetical protein
MFLRRMVVTRTWRAWIIHLAVDDRPSGPWIHVDARNHVIRRVEYTPPADRRRRLAAGSLLVLVVVLMAAVFFSNRVCNGQVTSSGKVISVCRHLQATDPPVIAMGIVIIAVLGVFYSEISGFGISIKRRVDEVDQTARAGLQLAQLNQEDTRRLTETTGDLATYNQEVRAQPEGATSPVSDGQADSPITGRIRDLADRYKTLRGTMPSSDHRTQLMADIVTELRRLLSEVSDFDVNQYLESADRGIRLAAYAYLMEHEAPQYISLLVEKACDEDKPFGQYTGLEALEHQVLTTAERLRDDDLRSLSSLAQRLGPNEDRTQLANRIVAEDRSKS